MSHCHDEFQDEHMVNYFDVAWMTLYQTNSEAKDYLNDIATI